MKFQLAIWSHSSQLRRIFFYEFRESVGQRTSLNYYEVNLVQGTFAVKSNYVTPRGHFRYPEV